MTEVLTLPPERICVDCNSITTYGTQWYHFEDGLTCNKCYERRKYKMGKRKRFYRNTKVCLYCGGPFRKSTANIKFCNNICKKKYKILK